MLDILNIHINGLRDLIKSKILSNSVHLLLPTELIKNNKKFPQNNLIHYLPNEAFTLGNYFYLFRLCELVANKTYSPERYNTMASASSGKPIMELSGDESPLITLLPIINHLVCIDISCVNLFVAAVAWLTTDDFRWETLNPMIHDKLSYGLVLQYPDYIIPMCCMIADYKRYEFLEDIDKESLEMVKTHAIRDVVTLQPNSKNIEEFSRQQQINSSN